MNIHYGNQSQFELFPGTTGESIESVAPRFIFSRVTLTFENLVVVLVTVIVGLIVAFSIGVEKGKRLTLAGPPEAQMAVPASPARMTVPPVQVSSSAPVMAAPAVKPQPAPVMMAQTVAAEPATADPTVNNAPPEKGVDKRYTIQVASYKTQTYAQKEANALKRQGFEALVVTKGNFSIVCVGQFAGEDQAKTLLKKLKTRYKDCIVRSL